MTKSTSQKERQLVIMLLLMGLVAWNRLFGAGGDQNTELVLVHQRELSQACAVAITNIIRDVQQIAARYPPLNNFGTNIIENVGSIDVPSYHVKYLNGVRIVHPLNTLSNTMRAQSSGVIINNMRATDDRVVIDNEGAELEILIQDMDSPSQVKMWGNRFRLLSVNGHLKLSLIYHLSLHSTNQVLEEVVSNIIQRRTTSLRESLREIVGIDLDSERTRLCAAAVTNILVGLYGLQKQFVPLNDLSIATIRLGSPANSNDVHLRYWKNVKTDIESNAQSQAYPPAEKLVVAGDGAALDFYILNVDEPLQMRSDTYHMLVARDGRVRVRYSYSMQLGLRDNALRSAVGIIVEKQVEQLRQELKDTTDFD